MYIYVYIHEDIFDTPRKIHITLFETGTV